MEEKPLATWKLFTGTGVCDVCLRPVTSCKSVYEVPNENFYSSVMYKNKVSEIAAAFGVTADQYLRRMRAMDTSAYSVVCDQCIGLFENDITAPDPPPVTQYAQPPDPSPAMQCTKPPAVPPHSPPPDTMSDSLSAPQYTQPLSPAPDTPTIPQYTEPPDPSPDQPPPTLSELLNIPPAQAKRKINPYILGSVAAFIAIAGAVLYFGMFGIRAIQNLPDTMVPTVGSPADMEPALSVDEEIIMAEITSKLPGKIREASMDSMYIPLLQDAVASARITDPVFSDYGVKVTVLLPDPGIVNLRSLNIAPYTPFSGAQKYIRENYQNLKNVATISAYMAIDVKLTYLYSGAAVKELDWSFPHETFVIMEYSAIFESHIDQYMTELGFYTAVEEILMPDFQRWESHTGAVSDQALLDAYFRSLAEALAYKGVEYNGNLTVDAAQIELLINQRFAQCWAFDNLSAGRDHFSSSLKFNSYSHGILFHEAVELKQAQYRSGEVSRPTSYDALEQEFLAMLDTQINDSFDMLSKNVSAGVDLHNYYFEWEKLGEKGISACPDLIEYIRTFLNSYDTHMGILAHPDL